MYDICIIIIIIIFPKKYKKFRNFINLLVFLVKSQSLHISRVDFCPPPAIKTMCGGNKGCEGGRGKASPCWK